MMTAERVERKPSSPYPIEKVHLHDLEQGLRIDEHALEDSWKEQPELFYRVSKKLALLISERDEAKRDLALVEAEVDEELRKDAREKEVKITEREIESRKLQDKEVVKSYERLARLNLQVSEYGALKESFSQRSFALSKLVELYLAEYYGDRDPKTRGGEELINRKAQEAKDNLRRKRLERDRE